MTTYQIICRCRRLIFPNFVVLISRLSTLWEQPQQQCDYRVDQWGLENPIGNGETAATQLLPSSHKMFKLLIIMFGKFQVQLLRLSVTMLFFRLTNKVFLCTKQFIISSNSINVYFTKYQNKNMQRSNRTELCDATRNKKQSRFETHLGSDATQILTK